MKAIAFMRLPGTRALTDLTAGGESDNLRCFVPSGWAELRGRLRGLPDLGCVLIDGMASFCGPA